MKVQRLVFLSMGMMLAVTGCSSTPTEKLGQRSFLQKEHAAVVSESSSESEQAQQPTTQKPQLSYLAPYQSQDEVQRREADMLSQFSDTQMVQVTADALALKDYLHYVFGELLGVSYVLGDGVDADARNVTLNLQQPVSKRKLFTLSQEVLQERQFLIRYADGLFYVQKQQGQGGQVDTIFAYGNNPDSVPDTSLDILQMVPFNFGTQTAMGPILQNLTGVKVTQYTQRELMLLQGKRRDIVRALEFIALMDQPVFMHRQIGMYRPTFVSLQDLEKALPDILKQEGLSLKPSSPEAAISTVKLDRLNALILFANRKDLIDRAIFWAEKIDQPSDTEEKQYFIYQPQYSRAVDLGQSMQLLIDGGASSSAPGRSTSAASQNNSGSTPATQANRGFAASNETMRMVVDERANTLIFQTTGLEYKGLLPLIKRLDVMPKQVALEVMIAEVTLTDKYRQGVEFNLTRGDSTFSTIGAFGGDKLGGLSYVLSGSRGKLNLNLFASDSLVNVLSRPSIVVRDGVAANIKVGTDIPVIGETTIDPNDSNSIARTSITYRNTGVDLSVTPTVNALGVVTLVIKQSISSQVDDVVTVANSPAIFERSVSTEVVASDGQTVILGGLISENKSQGSTGVPLLKDLPLLGNLFKADTNSGDKTELVVMVTPRIIDNAEEWESIKRQMAGQLQNIDIN